MEPEETMNIVFLVNKMKAGFDQRLVIWDGRIFYS